ncbi:MAG: membrane protein insertase YidC, partial [Candidatus Deferrimicrobiaceae bacterium]
MQKRMILAIVLSIAIMLAWQRLFAPEPAKTPPPTPQQQEAAKAGTGDNAAGAAQPPVQAVAQPPVSGGMAPGRENPLRWITVKTPLYNAVVSTAGGGIQSFSLLRYTDHPPPKGKPLDIIGSGAIRPLPLDLYLGESQPAFPALPVFASDAPDELSVPEGGKVAVSLSWQSAGGVRIDREYT